MLVKLLEKSPPACLRSGPHPRCAGAAGARARGSGWKRCVPLNADSEMSTFIRGAVTARPRGLGALCSREPRHPRLHPARTPNPEPRPPPRLRLRRALALGRENATLRAAGGSSSLFPGWKTPRTGWQRVHPAPVPRPEDFTANIFFLIPTPAK